MTDESSILEKIAVRAWEDSEFKEELLKNPKVVIEGETGDKIPEGLEIQVVEDTLTTRHLILPRQGTIVLESGETEPAGTDDPLSEVITKAVEDSSFRERLISNPNAVVAEELGVELPEGAEIRVIEQQDNLRYFVIPFSPDWEQEQEGELLEPEGWKIGKIKVNATISIGGCKC